MDNDEYQLDVSPKHIYTPLTNLFFLGRERGYNFEAFKCYLGAYVH
jgi:hypothetical protein